MAKELVKRRTAMQEKVDKIDLEAAKKGVMKAFISTRALSSMRFKEEANHCNYDRGSFSILNGSVLRD